MALVELDDAIEGRDSKPTHCTVVAPLLEGLLKALPLNPFEKVLGTD